MTAAELIAQAAKRLSDAGVPEPELDGEDIISGSVPHGSGAFPYEPDATADRGTENAAGDV